MHHTSRTILCALCLLLCACGPDKEHFRFEGRIKGVQQAEFYVYCEDGPAASFDTVRIDGGKFRYERPLSGACVLTLLYPNFTRTYIAAQPGKTVRMEGDAAALGEADIAGTDDNEQLTHFRRTVAHRPEADRPLAAAQFIRDHAGAQASVALLMEFFAQAPHPGPAQTRQLLAVLRKAQTDNRQLQQIAERLQERLVLAPGEPLPRFEATTLAGQTISEATYAGEPLLILVVATWQGESWQLLQPVRSAQQNGSHLRVLVLSADYDVPRSRQWLESQQLSADLVCQGRGLSSPLLRRLGISRVPQAILISADGRVKNPDMSREQLTAAL